MNNVSFIVISIIIMITDFTDIVLIITPNMMIIAIAAAAAVVVVVLSLSLSLLQLLSLVISIHMIANQYYG